MLAPKGRHIRLESREWDRGKGREGSQRRCRPEGPGGRLLIGKRKVKRKAVIGNEGV